MNKRIELHELIKLAIHLHLCWETRTAKELEEDILEKTGSATVLDAIETNKINRNCPGQMYLDYR